jgi:hypothetical protein
VLDDIRRPDRQLPRSRADPAQVSYSLATRPSQAYQAGETWVDACQGRVVHCGPMLKMPFKNPPLSALQCGGSLAPAVQAAHE